MPQLEGEISAANVKKNHERVSERLCDCRREKGAGATALTGSNTVR